MNVIKTKKKQILGKKWIDRDVAKSRRISKNVRKGRRILPVKKQYDSIKSSKKRKGKREYGSKNYRGFTTSSNN